MPFGVVILNGKNIKYSFMMDTENILRLETLSIGIPDPYEAICCLLIKIFNEAFKIRSETSLSIAYYSSHSINSPKNAS